MRTVCGTKDEFYHRNFSKCDAFKIPLKIFQDNLPFSENLRNPNLVATALDLPISKTVK